MLTFKRTVERTTIAQQSSNLYALCMYIVYYIKTTKNNALTKRQNIYCVIIIQHIRTSQNRLHKSRRGCLYRINILCHLNINVSLYEYLFTTFPTPWCRLSSSSSSSDTHESIWTLTCMHAYIIYPRAAHIHFIQQIWRLVWFVMRQSVRGGWKSCWIFVYVMRFWMKRFAAQKCFDKYPSAVLICISFSINIVRRQMLKWFNDFAWSMHIDMGSWL